jgi:hypothetical protein
MRTVKIVVIWCCSLLVTACGPSRAEVAAAKDLATFGKEYASLCQRRDERARLRLSSIEDELAAMDVRVKFIIAFKEYKKAGHNYCGEELDRISAKVEEANDGRSPNAANAAAEIRGLCELVHAKSAAKD